MVFDFEAQAERKNRISKKTKVFLQQVKKVAIGYLPLRVKNKKPLVSISRKQRFRISLSLVRSENPRPLDGVRVLWLCQKGS
jgi:hypothetical protein